MCDRLAGGQDVAVSSAFGFWINIGNLFRRLFSQQHGALFFARSLFLPSSSSSAFPSWLLLAVQEITPCERRRRLLMLLGRISSNLRSLGLDQIRSSEQSRGCGEHSRAADDESACEHALWPFAHCNNNYNSATKQPRIASRRASLAIALFLALAHLAGSIL